jgi:hypothetical protein
MVVKKIMQDFSDFFAKVRRAISTTPSFDLSEAIAKLNFIDSGEMPALQANANLKTQDSG